MSYPTNPDATAFPVTSDAQQFFNLSGLTKREHFAGLALQGMLANDAWMRHVLELPDRDLSVAATAQNAVETADALIAALNKEANG